MPPSDQLPATEPLGCNLISQRRPRLNVWWHHSIAEFSMHLRLLSSEELGDWPVPTPLARGCVAGSLKTCVGAAVAEGRVLVSSVSHRPTAFPAVRPPS